MSIRSAITALAALAVAADGSPVRRAVTSGSVPDYVLAYAPIVYLSSSETYFPSDLSTHLSHLTAEAAVAGNNNTVAISGAPYPLTLGNLNATSIGSSTWLSLTTEVDMQINSTAAWLNSDYGKPDSSGKSAAAVPIIVADKSNSVSAGTVDAFYFYFYSYNLGPAVFGSNYGNHVGDWEYSMIRFVNGTPAYIFVSAHSGGEVYTWNALQKEGNRPVTYSAVGTHANYATPGDHNISDSVPSSLVKDRTDAGVRWDVAANYQAYWRDVQAQTFTAATGNSNPTNWLYPFCQWGDRSLPLSDPRQEIILGFARFGDGPTGPIDKSLDRLGVSYDSSVPTNTALPAVVSTISQSQAAALARGSADSSLLGRAPGLGLILSLGVAPSLAAALLRWR